MKAAVQNAVNLYGGVFVIDVINCLLSASFTSSQAHFVQVVFAILRSGENYLYKVRAEIANTNIPAVVNGGCGNLGIIEC